MFLNLQWASVCVNPKIWTFSGRTNKAFQDLAPVCLTCHHFMPLISCFQQLRTACHSSYTPWLLSSHFVNWLTSWFFKTYLCIFSRKRSLTVSPMLAKVPIHSVFSLCISVVAFTTVINYNSWFCLPWFQLPAVNCGLRY